MKRLELLTMILALGLASCSSRTTVQTWHDNQGNTVPVTVTVTNQDTVYNFGTIIMYEDTTYVDTLKH
jgi:uncharacterized lipoprotein YmbA